MKSDCLQNIAQGIVLHGIALGTVLGLVFADDLSPMFNSFREHPEGSTIANDEDNPFSAAKKRRTTI